MTARTIVTIREILIAEREKARKEKDDLKKHLMYKYETDWISSAANKEELELLDMVQEKYFDINDALEDFDAHQW